MTDLKAELAEEIVHSVQDDVARFVLEDGVRHTQALQTAAHALDARATQVAYILFAAAALAASVIDGKLTWTGVCAVAAMGMFIWGGLISFRAVRSDDFRVPGLEPAWWDGALKLGDAFTIKEARAWAARQQQIVIDHICAENVKRADALNASLRAGVGGAVLIGLAAALKLAPAVRAFVTKNF
jgi:hypothetical protein